MKFADPTPSGGWVKFNREQRGFVRVNYPENVWNEFANLLDSNHEVMVSKYKNHDDVIKWKHFPRYWPFVRGIHRSPVNSPNKGQWRGALIFTLISALNKRLNNQSWGWWFETPSHTHYDVIVMWLQIMWLWCNVPILCQSHVCLYYCKMVAYCSGFSVLATSGD